MKKRIVRLMLWLCFIAGLSMSFCKFLDTQNTERVHEEAAQIAGLYSTDNALQNRMNLPGGGKKLKITKTNLKAKAGVKAWVKLRKMPETSPIPKEAAFLADMDLEALQEINPDVIGWIAIPGTKLSYPLVQGEDNEFYLDHNWKKESNISGAIFLESTNQRNFSDFHTIIYGHRMRDNSMFGLLKYYQESAYWKEHPDFYVAVGKNIYRYAVFSAHETSITSHVYRLDLEEKGLEKEFLQFCIGSSVLLTDSIPEWEAYTTTSKVQVVTLSTCTGRGHTTRWVVQGYLVQKYFKT